MPYFKTSSNEIHFLDDAEFAYLLPVGVVAITDAEAHALQRAAQPPPSAPMLRQWSSLEFFALFTDAEALAIATAAMQSPQVKLWYDMTLAANFLLATDPRVAAGLNALVAAGLLTQVRSDAIVAQMVAA